VRRLRFGAAGVWDSVCPRRLSDMVVRPLNFTVRCRQEPMLAPSRLKIFLATAVPFGVAMMVPGFGRLPLLYTVTKESPGRDLWRHEDLAPRRAERRLKTQGIEPGTADPVQEASVEVVGGLSEVYEASKRALLSLRKARLTRDEPITGKLQGRTGVTWSSFGELITVQITGDGPDATVHVVSKPRLSTVRTDLSGKNTENVALFLRHLCSELQPRHLTIVGGGREAWCVCLRGRLGRVCARVAWPASVPAPQLHR